MDKETFSCKDAFLEEFRRKAAAIERRYPVILHLAEIFGERWSYVAGTIPDAGQMTNRHRLKVNTYFGLVIYSAGDLNRMMIETISREILC